MEEERQRQATLIALQVGDFDSGLPIFGGSHHMHR